MKTRTLVKTAFAAAAAALAAMPASHGQPVVWSWAAGDAPYVAPNGSNTAVFYDNDGAVWKFQDAPAGLADPAGWETLASTPELAWVSSAAPPDGSATAFGTSFAFLQTGNDVGDGRTSSFALVFDAPFTGTYTIGGAAWLGQWGGTGNAQILVGKIQSNTWTTLLTYEDAPWSGMGPQFDSFTELQSISLNAGDSIGFVLPHAGFNGQRWWLYDPAGTGLHPMVNENALEITGVPASAPTISIARNGSSMEVTWTGGNLESTVDLAAGPWTSVPDATSPYVFTAAEPQRFFRAVQP